MATDLAEMQADDPTNLVYTGTLAVPESTSIQGRLTASMPTGEDMMDAGYNPSGNCSFHVLQSILDSAGVDPTERGRFTQGAIVWTIQGVDVFKSDDTGSAMKKVFTLKKIE